MRMIDRRLFLKTLIALGITAPLIGPVSGSRARGADDDASDGSGLAQFGPTSRQLAGQRVIYSYAGLTPPDSLFEAIRAGECAGVIFFGENITSIEQIATVARQLRDAQEASPVAPPLLLMTDQEGGMVRRLPGQPVQSAKQAGQSADPGSASANMGTLAGQNLVSAGMNVNLAPVLGVYRERGDFLDQYERSFSNNLSIVAECGRAFISAQQLQGVAATAKHFPGLGTAGANANTDAQAVTLPVSLATLRTVDEAPYADAIDAEVKLIMASWALYPDLDGTYPAGLSPTIIQRELRGRFGYQGVTITDALEAGSLSAFGDDSQRALLAAGAGMDLILCSARTVGQGQAVTIALANSLDNGQLDATSFEAAVDRVTALRSGLTTSRYFAATGHWVSHGFLSYWSRFGGLPVFGYPITDEYTDSESGYITQYFERARFEWHPGSWPDRYDVLLGLLGNELARRQGLFDTEPFQRVEGGESPNCTYYPETGHWLCYGFRDYWNAHGGLEIIGFPISEEFQDSSSGLTVQYFERQRLEWHPENAPEWQILGGLLGSQLLPPDL
jgi:beta-N-acetylhexosaminidase